MKGTIQKTIPAGGGVKATVWLNQSNEGRSYHSISVSRSYQAEGGEWKETNSYRRDDLPRVEYAVRKAFDFIIEQQYTVETPDRESGHAANVQRDRAESAKTTKEK